MDDWKQVRLSLEKPYDEPVLYDITPQGEHVYETKESPAKILGQNLRRIFLERGHDFFDRHDEQMIENGVLIAADSSHTNDDAVENNATAEAEETPRTIMTTEELFKMRTEIMPQLYIALGEMTLSRDLLSMILSSTTQSTASVQPQPTTSMQSQPNPTSQNPLLSATTVSKAPSIPSVQAFNAQLAIGGKDEALRKAADVFKSAARIMERGRARSDKYWVDALRIRRANWGLVPAPLPFGSATGKGVDRTTKDFLISYGLEESPPAFRRQAIARMASAGDPTEDLTFPSRQRARLRVSVTETSASGERTSCYNTIEIYDEHPVDSKLKIAQFEIVEQEIFSLLVKEAGTLPTVSARVSERLIVIDAAQGTELRFELAEQDETSVSVSSADNPTVQVKCDLVYHLLHVLLLRRHAFLKSQRLGGAGLIRSIDLNQAPPVLQPIIDLLQYEVFCQRVKLELDTTVGSLSKTGTSSSLRFNPIGEIGQELISFFSEAGRRSIGGEAVLRIEEAHTIRLTFLTPSSLTAHLAQATLSIASIRQLYQLLRDEVERFLLQRICDVGRRLCGDVGGIWFVDLNRCVGRWELSVLNFRILFEQDSSITCTSYFLNRQSLKQGRVESYTVEDNEPLITWVERIIQKALGMK